MHMSVEVPDDDERSVDELVKAVEGAIEVGSDNPSVSGLEIVVVMAEEI
jgi:hypothetical protein